MMDENSISEIRKKQENGAANSGEKSLDISVEENIMTTESQDARSINLEKSQPSQLNIDQQSDIPSSLIDIPLKASDVEDNPNEMRDIGTKTVQDGGEIVTDEIKAMIEAKECSNEEKSPNNPNKDDDIVFGTPSDIFASSSRQLLGTSGAHKRKNDDCTDRAVKILRSVDDDVSSVIQKCHETEGELLSNIENDVKQEMSSLSPKKITDPNEITLDDVENTNAVINDDVNPESFQALSQALETVLNDDGKMDVVENPEIVTIGLKDIQTDCEMIDETDINEKPTVQVIKDSDDSLKQINKSKDDDVDSVKVSSAKNTRVSIEVVYDKASASPVKPRELVEIDEDGEKIVLDSSQEDGNFNDSDTTSKKKYTIKTNQLVGDLKQMTDNTDNKLTNGSEHIKAELENYHLDTATTKLASDSDRSMDSCISVPSTIPKMTEILNLISDSEEDSFMNEEKTKIKSVSVEKEMTVLVKIKCLFHVDEVSKEITGKEVVSASCESMSDLQLSRMRNCSALGLADISDGKDSVSPSSVTSNQRPYPLNPRFSTMSMVSSSSSSSSGSFKLPGKDAVQFSLPRGVPKHAKKVFAAQPYEETSEKSKKEWKNINTLTTSLLTFLNTELITIDLHNGTVETTQNTSEHFRSSTPETPQENSPISRGDKKVRLTKRTRRQSFRKSSSNGLMEELKCSPEVVEKISENEEKKVDNRHSNESPTSIASTPSRQSSRSLSVSRNQTSTYDLGSDLIGKQCFAKWGDNNYYPGVIVSRPKSKLRINFLDGVNKLLMEDFVVIIPPILPLGLSIYAALKDDSYGSCGIITDVDNSNDTPSYTVETDEGEKLQVNIRDIFLTTDQVKILKETMNEDTDIPPSTPPLMKISPENVTGTNRKSVSPTSSTSKSARGKFRDHTTKKSDAKPSGSGVSSKIDFDRDSDTDMKTSDSNISAVEDNGLGTVQMEIIGNSCEYANKGPQSRLKGKTRSKKRVDNQETIALLGPIPEEGSTLFKGMNFILTCASLDLLDKYKMEHKCDSNSESGTDLEQDWNKTPFVRERLTAQITAGGGKVYDKFEDIPINEYEITKLITNVPNITAKSLQCLSAGIQSWNHQWVIRSCLDNKLVNPNQEKLPAGWSLDRNLYVEMSERISDKPFNHIMIAVPKISGAEESTKFWTQIIQNAGGTVKLIENQSHNFIEASAVLTNRHCPIWIVKRAQSENIPLVSTTWIVQCLIAGFVIPHDSQPAYFHYNMK